MQTDSGVESRDCYSRYRTDTYLTYLSKKVLDAGMDGSVDMALASSPCFSFPFPSSSSEPSRSVSSLFGPVVHCPPNCGPLLPPNGTLSSPWSFLLLVLLNRPAKGFGWRAGRDNQNNPESTRSLGRNLYSYTQAPNPRTWRTLSSEISIAVSFRQDPVDHRALVLPYRHHRQAEGHVNSTVPALASIKHLASHQPRGQRPLPFSAQSLTWKKQKPCGRFIK
ncbi:hypothetical protein J3F83DRAFT_349851 [Trichoderma novae-zelandiae]